jgi:hypothetical protein
MLAEFWNGYLGPYGENYSIAVKLAHSLLDTRGGLAEWLTLEFDFHFPVVDLVYV